jgi:hypothetical protein
MGLMTKIRVGLDYDYDYDSTIRVLIYYSYILNPPSPLKCKTYAIALHLKEIT